MTSTSTQDMWLLHKKSGGAPYGVCWSYTSALRCSGSISLGFTPFKYAETVTREKAGVAWLWVELAEAEGAVGALRQSTGGILTEQLGETSPPSEVDPELVENVRVQEVVPVGDWRGQERKERLRERERCVANIPNYLDELLLMLLHYILGFFSDCWRMLCAKKEEQQGHLSRTCHPISTSPSSRSSEGSLPHRWKAEAL